MKHLLDVETEDMVVKAAKEAVEVISNLDSLVDKYEKMVYQESIEDEQFDEQKGEEEIGN